MAEPFDLLAMGRVGVDLYPARSGVPLEDVETFERSLGGTATNVAVACARLGRRVSLLTRVGDDPFGRYVVSALERFGVDTTHIGVDRDLRTPLAFCEMHPPDDFPLLFYREPKAPDMNLTTEDLSLREIGRARILWTIGSALAEEPSRSATLAAIGSRPAGGITIHDLDYRPAFWESPRQAGQRQGHALSGATVAVGNRSEVEVVVGRGPAEKQAQTLMDRFGLELVVLKLGPRGVLAMSDDGTSVAVPPIPVEVVNGLGAGDAFGGALCHGLLSGWDLRRVIEYANAAGALVAARLKCADDMPRDEEIEAMLGSGDP